MRGRLFRVWCVPLLLLALSPGGGLLFAATDIIAVPERYTSRLFFSPKTITVTAGTEFDASLFIDTAGFTVNTIDIKISFTPNLLTVVEPSSGQSIVDLWVAPPKYSNTRGTMEFSGIVPGGVKVESGLVEKMTFKAVAPGTAYITIANTSRILINDGLGTEAGIMTTPLRVVIEPKTPDGIVVTSNTHPDQGEWSNNKNPAFSWERSAEGESYSYVLDDKPSTVPDDEIEGADTEASFDNIKDGVWYFHLKAKVGRIWSNTTHYPIRVDSTPPAQFAPTVNFLNGSPDATGIVSFFTTDALSGVSRYEVGALDLSSQSDTLPAFIQSESPYFLPKQISRKLLVAVRATDNAGNVRDATINITIPPLVMLLANQYSSEIIASVSVLVFLISASMFVSSRRRRHWTEAMHPDDLKQLLDYLAQNSKNKGLPGMPQAPEREMPADIRFRIANTPADRKP